MDIYSLFMLYLSLFNSTLSLLPKRIKDSEEVVMTHDLTKFGFVRFSKAVNLYKEQP